MATLQVGDKAPDFKGVDQNGNPISLADFRGKKLILYFYPKDDTPGCTAQACNLRDNYQSLLSAGYQVVGVSADDVKSHQKFRQKYQLPFPLVADVDQKISQAYGVWGPKMLFGHAYEGIIRTTFLINEDGVIEHILDKPDTEHHTQEVLSVWETRV